MPDKMYQLCYCILFFFKCFFFHVEITNNFGIWMICCVLIHKCFGHLTRKEKSLWFKECKLSEVKPNKPCFLTRESGSFNFHREYWTKTMTNQKLLLITDCEVIYKRKPTCFVTVIVFSIVLTYLADLCL